jgi:hypothetical protein
MESGDSSVFGRTCRQLIWRRSSSPEVLLGAELQPPRTSQILRPLLACLHAESFVNSAHGEGPVLRAKLQIGQIRH